MRKALPPDLRTMHYAYAFCLIGCAALLSACASSARSGGPQADTGAASFQNDSGEEDADTGEPAVPASWWTLEGEITLDEDGLPETGAQFTVTLFGLNKDSPKPVCSLQYSDVTLTAVDPTPDETIFHWWDLSAQAPKSHDCNAHKLPTLDSGVSIGVGALHADIKAALGSTRFAGLQDDLYGSYISLDASTTVWAYGVSATSSLEPLVTTAPLPAGTYTLQGVYLLPL